MTLKEARIRTGFDLLSDDELSYWSWSTGSGSVREGQRSMERKYPLHRLIRRTALKYFKQHKWDIYPRGITVNGTGTCPDFAIFNQRKIIFIECLTERFVETSNVKKKRGVEKFAEIRFVVEEKPKNEFDSKRDFDGYINRVKRLARKCVVYWCNAKNRQIRIARFK
ncbi:MAG TPA: hypothetical protein VLX91_01340 [Candidatus Acidoferrales bacterium]|nr:hypothetical protein [Candidatus Acidoferrales bacterium]